MRLPLIVAAVLVLSGCASTATPDGRRHPTHSPTRSPSAHPSGSPTPAPSTSPPSGVVVAQGHGWTPTGGLEGPVPAPNTCHLTDTNIHTTVCRPGGYTSSVRPPESLTEPMKLRLLAAYGIPTSQAAQYELDHFVALNDGGASDVRNLFPEPNADLDLYKRSTFVRNDKDAVESYTFHAICAGTVKVTQVQAAIVVDWSTAVAKLGLPPIPAGYTG